MKNKLGYTLVELLLGLGIFSILIVVLSQVFGAIMTMKLKSASVSVVSSDARYLMTRLSYDVARSNSVTVPNATSLVLTVGADTYAYALSGNNLTLTKNAGSAELLHTPSTTISALTFIKLDDLDGKQSVRVNLSLNSTFNNPGGVVDERHFTSTYATR